MPSERQHVNEQLDRYGQVMREAFKHMIAIKRWDSLGRPLTREETSVRKVSIGVMARFMRTLPKDDWDKIKWFTIELKHANLADKDDIIIEDTLYRLGVSRLST